MLGKRDIYRRVLVRAPNTKNPPKGGVSIDEVTCVEVQIRKNAEPAPKYLSRFHNPSRIKCLIGWL